MSRPIEVVHEPRKAPGTEDEGPRYAGARLLATVFSGIGWAWLVLSVLLIVVGLGSGLQGALSGLGSLMGALATILLGKTSQAVFEMADADHQRGAGKRR